MVDWWQYPTNYTDRMGNITSVNVIGDLFANYPASIVPGIGLGIISVMWLIFFSLSVGSGVKKAIMTSSFITLILGVFLWRIALIDVWVLFVLIVLIIVGAIGSKNEYI